MQAQEGIGGRRSSEASQDSEDCPLPLRLPSVVGSSIFPCLTVDDLKRCRSVCSMWADEGTKVMTRRSSYHLRSLEDVSDFIKHFKMADSVTNLGKSKEFRFKISVIPDADVANTGSNREEEHGRSVLDEPEFSELWELVGKRTTYLELAASSWTCTSLIKLLYSSVPHLRHLRLEYAPVRTLGGAILKFSDMNFLKHYNSVGASELEITTFDFHCVGHGSDAAGNESALAVAGFEPRICRRYVMTELIKRMPKLKKFMCNDEQVGEEVFFYCVLEYNNENLFNKELAEFNFPIQINEEEVKRISSLLRYPLKSLNLVLRPGLRFPALYTFVSSLGSTLKTLKIDYQFLWSQIETFRSGKDLVNLENLTLVHFNGSVDFIQHMSKLKTLTLIKVNLSVAFPNDMEFDPKKPHGLSSFEVHSGHSNAGRVIFPDTYRSMIKLFPGLKRFRIEHCSDSSLKIITDGFKELEELFMENSICSDDGIIESLHKFESLHTLTLNSPKLSDRSLEGIGKCKKLRSLSLSSPRISGKSFISMLEISQLNLLSLELHHCYGVCLRDMCDIEKMLSPGARVVFNPHS